VPPGVGEKLLAPPRGRGNGGDGEGEARPLRERTAPPLAGSAPATSANAIEGRGTPPLAEAGREEEAAPLRAEVPRVMEAGLVVVTRVEEVRETVRLLGDLPARVAVVDGVRAKLALFREAILPVGVRVRD
jgi:hypothetical protein